MPEVDDYLGTEMPDGSVRLEGPLSADASKKRIGEIVDKEKLPVTSTLAANKGEAILKILGFILRRGKTNK